MKKETVCGFRRGDRVLVEFEIDQVRVSEGQEILEMHTVKEDGAKQKYQPSFACRPHLVHRPEHLKTA